MSWSALLKIGTAVMGKSKAAISMTGKVMGNVAGKAPAVTRGTAEIAKTVAKPVVYATKHPVTAVAAPGVAYAGWKALVDRQPVIESAKEYGKGVMEVAIGKEDSDAITDSLGKAKDTVTDVRDTITEGKGLLSSLNESLGGIKDFISNITGGEGLNMFGNFFGNIAKGNVSGMSFIGLIAAGLLTFGRFGWLGKIAGALLGMMMIGNNSKVVPSILQGEGQVAQLQQGQAQGRGMHR